MLLVIITTLSISLSKSLSSLWKRANMKTAPADKEGHMGSLRKGDSHMEEDALLSA